MHLNAFNNRRGSKQPSEAGVRWMRKQGRELVGAFNAFKLISS
jgi:hypothetical protein